MRLPTLNGLIRRRLLVNFRAAPEIVQKLLPTPFRPKTHHGHAIVGVCLIRLESIRPNGFPALFGISSENAAHRIAVEWNDESGMLCEGVFIPRRDTGSILNQLAGGTIFPGEHHAAQFDIKDQNGQIDFQMRSNDGVVAVDLVAQNAESLPATSCFGNVAETSAFFERGSIGYSVTRDARRLDGLELRTSEWSVSPLLVSKVFSSYFSDPKKFPKGSIEFDHALIMRNIRHRWISVKDSVTGSASTET